MRCRCHTELVSVSVSYFRYVISVVKLLASVPLDNPSWKPHEKSMTIQNLAVHIADIPNWVPITLERSELDFAKGDFNQKRQTL